MKRDYIKEVFTDVLAGALPEAVVHRAVYQYDDLQSTNADLLAALEKIASLDIEARGAHTAVKHIAQAAIAKARS